MRIFLILLATLISTSALAKKIEKKHLDPNQNIHWRMGVLQSIDSFGKPIISVFCDETKDRCVKSVTYYEDHILLMVILTTDAKQKILRKVELCNPIGNDRRECYNDKEKDYLYLLDPEKKVWRKYRYPNGDYLPNWQPE